MLARSLTHHREIVTHLARDPPRSPKSSDTRRGPPRFEPRRNAGLTIHIRVHGVGVIKTLSMVFSLLSSRMYIEIISGLVLRCGATNRNRHAMLERVGTGSPPSQGTEPPLRITANTYHIARVKCRVDRQTLADAR